MNTFVYPLLIVGATIAGFLVMLSAVRKIPEDHRGVLFRFGRLVRELKPGTAWVWPLIDQVMLVDLREQTFALPDGLSVANEGARYSVTGQYTCKVTAAIPAVMAARQAQQDISQTVGEKLLAEIKRMGVATALSQPAHAQQLALEALNEQMSRAWQLSFTKIEFTLTSVHFHH